MDEEKSDPKAKKPTDEKPTVKKPTVKKRKAKKKGQNKNKGAGKAAGKDLISEIRRNQCEGELIIVKSDYLVMFTRRMNDSSMMMHIAGKGEMWREVVTEQSFAKNVLKKNPEMARFNGDLTVEDIVTAIANTKSVNP